MLQRVKAAEDKDQSQDVGPLTIAVVGLGYVGLPLAVEFGKKYRTLGFDLSERKVAAYQRHVDPTDEICSEDFKAASKLDMLDRSSDPGGCRFHRRRGPDAGRSRAQSRPHRADRQLDHRRPVT